jgi:tetratricopeptide (TPR) repeat protein
MNRGKNWIVLSLALFLYIPLGLLQVKIDYNRKIEDLEGRLLLMPGQVAGNLVLGGFRGIAADLLWLNIEDFWHKELHYKMLPLFDSVSWLQPKYITVWAVGGWHMSYNIFADIGGKTEKLKKQMDDGLLNLSETEKRAAQPVLKIAEGVNKLKEDFQDYNSIGMPENEIPKITARIDRYDAELEELQKNTGIQPLVEIGRSMVSIPREQLFWYNKGINFLKRGVAYNPEKYDIYFELGWTYYHKGKDYKNASRYLEKAIKFPHPEYVDSVLAHAYELNGEADKALAQWEKQLDSGFKTIAERAVRAIKKDGAFNPRRRRILGLDPE